MADAAVSSDLSPSENTLGGAAWRQQALRFISDFGAFAGRRGLWGAMLAIASAAFESVGLVLLVPLLTIVTASGSTPNWIHRTATHVFDLTGAQSRTGQLSILLGLFGVLIIIR